MPVENAIPESDPTPAADGTPFQENAFSQALAETQKAGGDSDAGASPVDAGQQAAATATPNWLDVAKQKGFAVDQYKSPDEFLEALASERKQQSQYVDLGRQVAPHYQQFTSWQQEQQAAAAKQQQAQPAQAQQEDPKAWLKEHFSQAWKVPQWNQSWGTAINQGLVTRDDSGRWIAAPGAELQAASLLGPLNEFREAQAERMQDLFMRGNPVEQFYEAMAPAIQRQMEEMIQQSLGQHVQQVTHQSAMEQWESSRAASLYTQDTAGNQILTPAGEKLIDQAKDLLDNGFNDELKALELAAKLTGFPDPNQPPPTPARINEGKKQSFIENARQRAAHAPSSGAYDPTNTPDAPFSVDESELDNLFNNALASAGAK